MDNFHPAWARALGLFTNSVLVPSVLPGLDVLPRLGRKEAFERARRKHCCFPWLAIPILKSSHPRNQPHYEKWKRSPKSITRFRYETATTWFQNAIDLGYDAVRLRQDREQPGRYQNMKMCVRARKL